MEAVEDIAGKKREQVLSDDEFDKKEVNDDLAETLNQPQNKEAEPKSAEPQEGDDP